jgi:hypothetical protein
MAIDLLSPDSEKNINRSPNFDVKDWLFVILPKIDTVNNQNQAFNFFIILFI